MAYIEKDLPYSIREEMSEHLEECETCRAAYEKKLFVREQFSGIFNNEQLVFSSVKQGVMTAIRDTEYKVSWFQRLCEHFKRFGSSYAAVMAMMAFVILVVPNMGGMMKKDATSIAQNVNKSKGDYKFSGESTDSPVKNGIGAYSDDLNKALADIKTKELGVGPWRTIFADKNRVYFYNYSHLLVYDNSYSQRGITGAVDLIKLDLGSYQGSSIITFIPSDNGDYCVIVNNSPELDMINNKKPLYMYNAKNNSLQAIGQENLALMKTAWSNSSRYFAYGDIKGNMITIYDADKMAKQQIDFNNGEIKKIFIADNGDVLISSNKVYLLRRENSYKLEELRITAEALGFKNNQVIYHNNGSIYAYASNGSTEINKLGLDYEFYKEGNNIIFTNDKTLAINDKKLMIYDMKNNEFHSYSSKYLKASKNFSPDLKKFIDNDAGCVRIIGSNGTVREVAGSQFPFEYYWMDNNTLVRVPFKENPKYLGDFVIEKVDVNAGKSSIAFEMK